ncbi:MAG: dihydrofolate reductase family protein [Micrococcales bacterium]
MSSAENLQSAGLSKDWVIANFVTTPSGEIEVGGTSRGISNEIDRASLISYRRQADVVLTTAVTARAERYRRMSTKALALVSRTGDFEGLEALNGDGLLVLIVGRQALKSTREKYSAKDTLIIGLRKYSPRKIRRALKIRGFRRIVLEAGPSFTDWFASGRALSELALTIVGLKSKFAATDASAFFSRFEQTKFELLNATQLEDTALTIWAVSQRTR